MSKLTQKSCLTCESFTHTVTHGCICNEEGFEKMFREKTWPSFNSDYNAGKLKTGTPVWCPKHQNLLLQHIPQQKTRKATQNSELKEISLNATCIRALRCPFEKINLGEKITWINPELICKTLRGELRRLQLVIGKGPFTLTRIIWCPMYGITVFVFLTKKGRACEINSYLFSKWV